MPTEAINVRAIFDCALEISSEAERTAYLDEACAGSPEIRQEVEALLRAHSDAGSFLQSPAHGLTATEHAPAQGDLIGAQIGPYKLLQQIGEGGMGVVYMAHQEHPVQRMVALKIIKPGMDSTQVITRFEAERQALALMDHPNIAKVLDAGTTDSVRPYFVMELVTGIPIIQYADEHRLTPRSASNSLSLSARPSSTPIKRGSFIETSSPPMFWWPTTTIVPSPRSSISAWPKPSATI